MVSPRFLLHLPFSPILARPKHRADTKVQKPTHSNNLDTGVQDEVKSSPCRSNLVVTHLLQLCSVQLQLQLHYSYSYHLPPSKTDGISDQ
jgi:hypothetical protein